MPLPICVTCRREMRCRKNSFAVVTSGGIWDGDKYACPVCGVEVVVGFGMRPYIQSHDPRYELEVARIMATKHALRLEDEG